MVITQYTVRKAAEVENYMTSVERVLTYTKLNCEPGYKVERDIVREKLKDATVITIAHRLNTLKDCQMILVLKDGRVHEFDKFNSLVSTQI